MLKITLWNTPPPYNIPTLGELVGNEWVEFSGKEPALCGHAIELDVKTRRGDSPGGVTDLRGGGKIETFMKQKAQINSEIDLYLF